MPYNTLDKYIEYDQAVWEVFHCWSWKIKCPALLTWKFTNPGLSLPDKHLSFYFWNTISSDTERQSTVWKKNIYLLHISTPILSQIRAEYRFSTLPIHSLDMKWVQTFIRNRDSELYFKYTAK
jgi:hypothetical protein